MIKPFYFQDLRCQETRTGRRIWPVADLETLGLTVNCTRWLINDTWFISTLDLVDLLEAAPPGDRITAFRRYLLMEALEPLENLGMPPDLYSSEEQEDPVYKEEELDIPAGATTEEFAAWMLMF